MSTTICFTSDLHLFSKRSNVDLYLPALRQLAQRSDVFVFGGDIFDFKWSQYQTFEEGIDKSLDWLDSFISDCPDTRFQYLIGNHDCAAQFVDAASQVGSGKMEVEPYYLVHGRTLFMHGDVLDAGGTQQGLQQCRNRWQHGQPKGKIPNAIYDAAVAIGLHHTAARRLNTPNKVFELLNRYLIDIEEKSKIETVVYGHTHWKSDFSMDSIRFRNGGAAIKGLPFEPVVVQMDE